MVLFCIFLFTHKEQVGAFSVEGLDIHKTSFEHAGKLEENERQDTIEYLKNRIKKLEVEMEKANKRIKRANLSLAIIKWGPFWAPLLKLRNKFL